MQENENDQKQKREGHSVHLFDISNVSYVYTHNHVIYKRERERKTRMVYTEIQITKHKR